MIIVTNCPTVALTLLLTHRELCIAFIMCYTRITIIIIDLIIFNTVIIGNTNNF